MPRLTLPADLHAPLGWIANRLTDLQAMPYRADAPDRRVRYVTALADIDRAREESAHAPAVFVIYLGANSSKDARETCLQIVQRYLVVIAARDEFHPNENGAVAEEGGYLKAAVLSLLAGHTPRAVDMPTHLSPCSPLRFTREEIPYTEAGLALYGLEFETGLTYTLTNQ